MGEAVKVTVTLEANLEEFVRKEVARGSFTSSSAYIEAVLRERYEDERIERERKLEDALRKGIHDATAGRVMPLEEAFDKIRSELGLDKTRAG